MRIKQVAIMRRERTEALKAKRRIYGDTGGHLHFNEQVYVPRKDGISNPHHHFRQGQLRLRGVRMIL